MNQTHLYPNLYDKFKNEGICPICLMEMGFAPKYMCLNEHTLCHRCKPYYYACPICQSPLDIEIPPLEVEPPHMPPPIHFMPHPLPQEFHRSCPSAPLDPFIQHESAMWGPPPPSPDQELIPCRYAHQGCIAKIPEYLQELHESRCPYRPYLEEEQLPTDLSSGDELVECCYRMAGCYIMVPTWRKLDHESACVYKERFEALNGICQDLNEPVEVVQWDEEEGDPEEFMYCRYKKYGCMVRMKRRRKPMHQAKCNYKKYGKSENLSSSSSEEDETEVVVVTADEVDDEPEDYNPDERVDCRWAEFGCCVKIKLGRKETHEEKCNYRLEKCRYKENGCEELFHPSRRFIHERHCEFA